MKRSSCEHEMFWAASWKRNKSLRIASTFVQTHVSSSRFKSKNWSTMFSDWDQCVGGHRLFNTFSGFLRNSLRYLSIFHLILWWHFKQLQIIEKKNAWKSVCKRLKSLLGPTFTPWVLKFEWYFLLLLLHRWRAAPAGWGGPCTHQGIRRTRCFRKRKSTSPSPGEAETRRTERTAPAWSEWWQPFVSLGRVDKFKCLQAKCREKPWKSPGSNLRHQIA